VSGQVYPTSLERTFFRAGDEGGEAASALLVLLPLTLGIDKVGTADILSATLWCTSKPFAHYLMTLEDARSSCYFALGQSWQRGNDWQGARLRISVWFGANTAPPVTRCLSLVLQVNPRYVPQLQTVLTWPHSIGIVGGRPSSSLYFVGYQEENVLLLDPHETQQVMHITGPPIPSLSAV
jgi:Peptidase family C54